MELLQFTLSEAVQVLDPQVSEKQLRQIVAALRWEPAAWRRSGHRGHPVATYDAAEIMRLHQALTPFLRKEGLP